MAFLWIKVLWDKLCKLFTHFILKSSVCSEIIIWALSVHHDWEWVELLPVHLSGLLFIFKDLYLQISLFLYVGGMHCVYNIMIMCSPIMCPCREPLSISKMITFTFEFNEATHFYCTVMWWTYFILYFVYL